MPRLLLLLVLIFAAVWLWKRWQRALAAVQATRTAASGGAGRRLSEPMVACAECGTFSPASQSVSAAGRSFCCGEHADRFLQRQRSAQR
ncbi:PP0621 family protein [Chitinasiproducens palmae]|uniref:Deaminase n=1 Tax=Chitinasiproducens palmae TaxID=1770053 RepID=A0A1H2PRR2_9BURK|nr:PP0621 family protein [Chitinasiproducens palmae]SDV49556.1 hypothetical protein SAMN05216551_108185 [Chitinasiproducens palmae]